MVYWLIFVVVGTGVAQSGNIPSVSVASLHVGNYPSLGDCQAAVKEAGAANGSGAPFAQYRFVCVQASNGSPGAPSVGRAHIRSQDNKAFQEQLRNTMAETAPLRAVVSAQMKEAMKEGDKVRVGALRLIMAALKDREIEARGAGKIVSRADELALLTKMVKSRQESADIYAKAGRAELAAQERAEIAVIAEFLPKQMDEAGVLAAVKAAIAATGATGVKDMGKVVNALKAAHPGQMDFAKASAIVKGLLGG
jgi:uncharacterized protein